MSSDACVGVRGRRVATWRSHVSEELSAPWTRARTAKAACVVGAWGEWLRTSSTDVDALYGHGADALFATSARLRSVDGAVAMPHVVRVGSGLMCRLSTRRRAHREPRAGPDGILDETSVTVGWSRVVANCRLQGFEGAPGSGARYLAWGDGLRWEDCLLGAGGIPAAMPARHQSYLLCIRTLMTRSDGLLARLSAWEGADPLVGSCRWGVVPSATASATMDTRSWWSSERERGLWAASCFPGDGR